MAPWVKERFKPLSINNLLQAVLNPGYTNGPFPFQVKRPRRVISRFDFRRFQSVSNRWMAFIACVVLFSVVSIVVLPKLAE
jgi:hypothetical protein